ncbi:sedoheptulokinase isoform X3 [Ahaetulla prasina]|uniref:sedoheptulokinase isoform X3 n=1 Tax=Ahaetulla prasina TaxID=499056 RepID=UPI00264708AA|nr:sedoheptulokinase isoform X3 [Ahaetulla prasina]
MAWDNGNLGHLNKLARLASLLAAVQIPGLKDGAGETERRRAARPVHPWHRSGYHVRQSGPAGENEQGPIPGRQLHQAGAGRCAHQRCSVAGCPRNHRSLKQLSADSSSGFYAKSLLHWRFWTNARGDVLGSWKRPDSLTPFTAAGTIQDYVVAMLCGREKPQMSVQNAAAWGYFSSLEKSWNTKLLKSSGFPIRLLPEVVDSGDLAGETCQAWHRIPAGTKVGVALGDFQCSVYSCMSENSDAVLNVGTSAQLAVSMPPGFQPVESPDPNSPVQYFPYFDNRYLAVAASLNGGNVMATFVKMLVGWMAELGIEASESALYQPMIKAGLSHADTRLHICPTVFGERHAPASLASVTAIAASDISLGHVVRALCRGIVRNLHSMLPSASLKEAGAKRIVASGSGLCRNEVMKQEVEKAFALPVVYGKVADAAVGAAYVMLKRNYGTTEPEGTLEVF